MAEAVDERVLDEASRFGRVVVLHAQAPLVVAVGHARAVDGLPTEAGDHLGEVGRFALRVGQGRP